MKIQGLDHFVLTTNDIDKCIHFYRDVLGMTLVEWNGRYALQYGKAKINIHQTPAEFLPAAKVPTVGALDLCFAVDTPIDIVKREVLAKGVTLESDMVPRTGALGPMTSIYMRDPDGNLVELCYYDKD